MHSFVLYYWKACQQWSHWGYNRDGKKINAAHYRNTALLLRVIRHRGMENLNGLKENNRNLHMIPACPGNCLQTSMLTKRKRKPKHYRYCINTYWCIVWRLWYRWCWTKTAAGYYSEIVQTQWYVTFPYLLFFPGDVLMYEATLQDMNLMVKPC